MIDWLKVRRYVQRRTLFCAVAVVEEGKPRLFPIGSLRIHPDGTATYFEIFARPTKEGSPITFLAVDAGITFWLFSLLKGRFPHPPALRLYGTTGERRPSTEGEKQGWARRMKWLLKTPGGKALWSFPNFVREVSFQEAEVLKVGQPTRGLEHWLKTS